MTNRDGVAAFAVSHPRIAQQSGDKLTCWHCGKYGHAEVGCFELIGYPLEWSSGGGSGGRGEGLTTASQGHGTSKEMAHAMQTSHGTEGIEDNNNGITEFTPK